MDGSVAAISLTKGIEARLDGSTSPFEEEREKEKIGNSVVFSTPSFVPVSHARHKKSKKKRVE